MTASVIKSIAQDVDETLLGYTPFVVELTSGLKVKAAKRQDTRSGVFTVEIDTPPASDLSLSTMDAIARRVASGARILLDAKATGARRRIYSV